MEKHNMKHITLTLMAAGILLSACSEQSSDQPAVASSPLATSAAAQAMTCESLLSTNFPNTTISRAETIAAGAYSAPAGGFPGMGADYSNLPAFCQVAGSIHPTSDSDIRFELWLPSENWNGRFMQTGNGGAAGSIVTSSLADPLMRGYAVANTDTGHVAGGADIFGWAVDHPEKVTDFAWRAVHELTLTGKAITSSHYGSDPEKSYFVGCSTGGRQGLMEAQRFPDDYDAIIAGAPANNWSPLMALSIVIQSNLGEGKLALNKLGLLKEAAITSCDALDGVEDRIISNPAACNFNPARLQCAGETTAQCLAAEEVEAAQTIYKGVVSASGQVWIPGTGPGSEPLWGAYTSPQFTIGSGFFQDIVLNDANWDPASFNADEYMPVAMEAGSELIAMDPDISEFINHGGKLITYHGTTDGLIPFGNTVNYVESMIASLGQQAVNDSVRYYQVPGMDHCAGGEGAHAISWLDAMVSWVEEGSAPGDLVGIHPAPPPGAPGSDNAREFSRPVCHYPAIPTYDGSGDPDMARSFSCVAP